MLIFYKVVIVFQWYKNYSGQNLLCKHLVSEYRSWEKAVIWVIKLSTIIIMEIFSCYNLINKDCDLTFAYTECRVFCL